MFCKRWKLQFTIRLLSFLPNLKTDCQIKRSDYYVSIGWLPLTVKCFDWLVNVSLNMIGQRNLAARFPDVVYIDYEDGVEEEFPR